MPMGRFLNFPPEGYRMAIEEGNLLKGVRFVPAKTTAWPEGATFEMVFPEEKLGLDVSAKAICHTPPSLPPS